MNVCVEDYHPNIKQEEKLKLKVKFTDNATIINKDVKETRSTIEEIEEKEYEKKIKGKKNTIVKLADVK
tara:strand:+ start:275 stop:481 length:207 start_codon:yes stop_codon:yes gene_type:complete